MDLEILQLARKNIIEMQTFHSERQMANKEVKIFLDANENAFGSPLQKWYHRFPDPTQKELKEKISAIKNIPPSQIVLGNGSDVLTDMLMRIFCEPGKSNIISCTPAPDYIEAMATLNEIENRKVGLDNDFQVNLQLIESSVNENSKIMFLSSPNSVSGNNLNREDIESIIYSFPGIVVLNETYINFSRHRSFVPEIKEHPNLVVLQSFSHAWGLAGLNVDMAITSETIAGLLNKINASFSINSLTVEKLLEATGNLQDVNNMILETNRLKEKMTKGLLAIPVVEKIFSSDSNFLLVQFSDAKQVYYHLLSNGILVSDVSKHEGCRNCLRITVGNERENDILIKTLKDFK